jgi:hypothetical protein
MVRSLNWVRFVKCDKRSTCSWLAQANARAAAVPDELGPPDELRVVEEALSANLKQQIDQQRDPSRAVVLKQE